MMMLPTIEYQLCVLFTIFDFFSVSFYYSPKGVTALRWKAWVALILGPFNTSAKSIYTARKRGCSLKTLIIHFEAGQWDTNGRNLVNFKKSNIDWCNHQLLHLGLEYQRVTDIRILIYSHKTAIYQLTYSIYTGGGPFGYGILIPKVLG